MGFIGCTFEKGCKGDGDGDGVIDIEKPDIGSLSFEFHEELSMRSVGCVIGSFSSSAVGIGADRT